MVAKELFLETCFSGILDAGGTESLDAISCSGDLGAADLHEKLHGLETILKMLFTGKVKRANIPNLDAPCTDPLPQAQLVRGRSQQRGRWAGVGVGGISWRIFFNMYKTTSDYGVVGLSFDPSRETWREWTVALFTPFRRFRIQYVMMFWSWLFICCGSMNLP